MKGSNFNNFLVMICDIKRFVKYLLNYIFTYYVKIQLYIISSVEQSN